MIGGIDSTARQLWRTGQKHPCLLFSPLPLGTGHGKSPSPLSVPTPCQFSPSLSSTAIIQRASPLLPLSKNQEMSRPLCALGR
jgi:hypothetical protein